MGVHEDGLVTAPGTEVADFAEVAAQADPGMVVRVGRFAAQLAITAFLTATELSNRLPLTAFRDRHGVEEPVEQETTA